MNLKSDLIEPECDRFRRKCNFTKDERAIFDLRVKGRSIIEISCTAGAGTKCMRGRAFP